MKLTVLFYCIVPNVRSFNCDYVFLKIWAVPGDFIAFSGKLWHDERGINVRTNRTAIAGMV